MRCNYSIYLNLMDLMFPLLRTVVYVNDWLWFLCVLLFERYPHFFASVCPLRASEVFNNFLASKPPIRQSRQKDSGFIF